MHHYLASPRTDSTDFTVRVRLHWSCNLAILLPTFYRYHCKLKIYRNIHYRICIYFESKVRASLIRTTCRYVSHEHYAWSGRVQSVWSFLSSTVGGHLHESLNFATHQYYTNSSASDILFIVNTGSQHQLCHYIGGGFICTSEVVS